MIATTHLYATAFGSITPNCSCTTSNLMAMALQLSTKLLLESKSFSQGPPKGESCTMKIMGIDTQNYDFMLTQHWSLIYAHTKHSSFRAASCIVDCSWAEPNPREKRRVGRHGGLGLQSTTMLTAGCNIA